MRTSRFTETQLVAILKDRDAGVPTAELARRHGVQSQHAAHVACQVRRHGVQRYRSAQAARGRQPAPAADRNRSGAGPGRRQERSRKKLLRPSQRKDAVRALQAEGRSERRASKLAGCLRATSRYQLRRAGDGSLRERMNAIAAERRRFDYRKIEIVLQREGFVVNHKRVFRVYRDEGLAVRRRHKRHVRTSAGRWTSSPTRSLAAEACGS